MRILSPFPLSSALRDVAFRTERRATFALEAESTAAWAEMEEGEEKHFCELGLSLPIRFILMDLPDNTSLREEFGVKSTSCKLDWSFPVRASGLDIRAESFVLAGSVRILS